MPKISRDTPIDEVLELSRNLGACSEALDFQAKYKDVKAIANAVSKAGYKQSWAAWSLKRFGRVPGITEKFLEKITDPMIAFTLYLGIDWLTAEDDRVLESKFKGKLPVAEQELADGVVKRKKCQ